jgi:uncharacterized membrane protein YhaH (DUF805 family)
LTETPARSRFGAFFHLLFGFEGRIGRLLCFLGFLAFCAVVAFLSSIAEEATVGTGDIGRYVAFVIIVGTGIWMHAAIAIKRLHDRDKSAWWYLVYSVLPFALFIGAIHLYMARSYEAATLLFVLSFAGLIWAIVELGFLPGTAGPNRYGSPP